MANIVKELDGERKKLMETVSKYLSGNVNPLINFDVLSTGSNELCVPVVSENGEEGYIVLTFKIPKGSRDGEAYDGYAERDNYHFKLEENARKAKERADAKAKKIARDQKLREEKRKQKEAKTAAE